MNTAIVYFIAFAKCLPLVSEAAAPTRHLSDETRALIDSRLIFVYDDSGCRELEGMRQFQSAFDRLPLHRSLALSELERRLDAQQRYKQLSGAASSNGIKASELASVRPPLRTVYLEALEMEIAHVPEGMTLTELEQASEALPCVKFVARDDVKYAEEDNLDSDVSDENIRRFPERSPGPKSSLPSDPLYRFQWGLHRGNESSFGIDVERVWGEHSWHGSENMVIAIIDSGCNLNHPDMQGQFWNNPGETDCNDGIDNDGNGFIDDCHGWDFVDEDNFPQAEGTSHGTAAGGIIAAKSDNSEGIAGICTNCRLMCLRFISNTEGTVANEVRAIDYAVRMGAKISNNSYGGYAHYGSRVEQEAIERADRLGHLFVSSAGNNNIDSDSSEYIHTPSGYSVKNVLAVGASTETGRKTSFSNWGYDKVHLFAPGRNVISTGRDGYLVNQGTSFAAPHVAGIAGLIWSRYPSLTSDQIVQVLLSTCRTSSDLKGLARCEGVVNAYSAMSRAAELAQKGRTSLDESSLPSKSAQSSTSTNRQSALPAVVAFDPSPLEGEWLSPNDDDEHVEMTDGMDGPIAQMHHSPYHYPNHHFATTPFVSVPTILMDPLSGVNYTASLALPTASYIQPVSSTVFSNPQTLPPLVATPAPCSQATMTSAQPSSGTYILPASDMIWADHGHDVGASGLRSSYLSSMGPASMVAKKFMRTPISGAIDLVTAGLDNVPLLAAQLTPSALKTRLRHPGVFTYMSGYPPTPMSAATQALLLGQPQPNESIGQNFVPTFPGSHVISETPTDYLSVSPPYQSIPTQTSHMIASDRQHNLAGGVMVDVGERIMDLFDLTLAGFGQEDGIFTSASLFEKMIGH